MNNACFDMVFPQLAAEKLYPEMLAETSTNNITDRCKVTSLGHYLYTLASVAVCS